MILGKRTRPPIKRTTSMTEFTLELDINRTIPTATTPPVVSNISQSPYNPFNVKPPLDDDNRFLTATVTPRNHRRNSADHIQTHFLTVCQLCSRRLIPGRDIFMYRGDTAFCSFECRQEQMVKDEKKDKHPLIAKKQPLSVVSECSSNGSKID